MIYPTGYFMTTILYEFFRAYKMIFLLARKHHLNKDELWLCYLSQCKVLHHRNQGRGKDGKDLY